MAKVIKNWKANEVPDVNGNYVEVIGRESGIFSWVMSLIGLDPTDSLIVTSTRIEYSSTSISGKKAQIVPISKVDGTIYGYSKPVKSAVFILFVFSVFAFALAEVSGGAMVVVFIGGILLATLKYMFGKVITLGFSAGGKPWAIEFKRSAIENKNINEKQAEMVCELIQDCINAHQKPEPQRELPLAK